MNPAVVAALISVLGPQLLGRLFGGGGDARLRARIAMLLSPEAIGKRTEALQNEWYRSPAYGQSRTLASNQAQSEAGLLAGLGPAPSISREMLGSSLNFLGPLLTAYLKRKHPTMFAAGGMEPSGSFVRREEWA